METAFARKVLSIDNAFYSPHAFDSSRYPSVQKNRESALVVTVSWLERGNAERKGLPTLLRAIALAMASEPSVKLAVVGKQEPSSDVFYRLARDLQIADRVEFMGPVSEETKIDLLQRCTVYVQPSRFEGFGVAALEAMAAGAPVITTSAGAIPEVVGDAAEIVPVDDSRALAASIVALLRDPARRAQLSAAGYARAHACFELARRRREIDKILRIVASRFVH
jgi:glycosyltransferase involved in cell wall biosynthesis